MTPSSGDANRIDMYFILVNNNLINYYILLYSMGDFIRMQKTIARDYYEAVPKKLNSGG